MEKQLIISIGREFGSSGHEIAQIISEDMHLPLYDRRLLDELAQEKGIAPDVMHRYDEKKRNPLLSRSVKGHSNSIEDAISNMQFDYIRKKADSGESFVVVGRCSDVVLAGREALFSVFVLGDQETKVKHVMEKYHLNREDALTKMKRHDRTRKAYHNSHSKIAWGDSRGYDLCINSSRFGVDQTAKMIEYYANIKRMRG